MPLLGLLAKFVNTLAFTNFEFGSSATEHVAIATKLQDNPYPYPSRGALAIRPTLTFPQELQSDFFFNILPELTGKLPLDKRTFCP